MIKRHVILTIFLVFSSLAVAGNIIWDGSDSTLWQTGANWDLNRAPIASDTVYVGLASYAASSIVVDSGYTTPNVQALYIRPGAVLEVQTGGALNSAASVLVGSVANSNAGEIKISGGSYYGSSTDASSPRTRLGVVSGATGILTITAGTYSTFSLKAPYVTGATGKVNLFGGELICRANGDSALQLSSGGSIEMKDTGKLTLAGDRTELIDGTNGYIHQNMIYTSQVGKRLKVEYDGINTVVTVISEPAMPTAVSMSPINLDSAAFDAIMPNIAADGMGHVAVMWCADYANNRHPQNLYNAYSADGGTTFSFPALFRFDGNSLNYVNVQPNLVYDANGRLHFAWSLVDDVTAPVYTESSNYGLSWRPKLATATFGYSVKPRRYGIGLAPSPDGQTIRVIWYDCSAATDKRVYCGVSTNGGMTWATDNITALVPKVADATPAISFMSSAVMGADGSFYALSTAANQSVSIFDTLSFLRWNGAQWSYTYITPNIPSVSLANDHSIAIDKSGNLFITWSQNGYVYFAKSTNQGGTWTKVKVDPSSGTQDKSVIGLDTYGQLIIAWQDSRGTNRQIRWAESTDGGSNWSQSVAVSPSSADQNEPDMVIDGRSLHLVWIEAGSPKYVMVQRPISADTNVDGQVDFVDFCTIANYWETTGNLNWQMGDFSGDLTVDIADLALLAEHWLDLEIPAAGHSPLYNGENLFPNSTFDDFSGDLPVGWIQVL